MVAWPASLPQDQFLDTSYKRRDVRLRTQTDTGPGKVRRKFTVAAADVTVPLIVNGAQRQVFDDFYETTLQEGSLPFDWEDPVTDTVVEFLFKPPVPEWEMVLGGLTGLRLWRTTLNLEIVPGLPTAVNFFVDFTGGLDANNGTSSATPWKTLAKVNAMAFIPGAVIAFKRGETWNGQLAIDDSGAPGAPITFTAYGTGADPHLQNPGSGASGDAVGIDASWVIFEHFEVTQAHRFGIRVSGNNNVVRHNEVHKGAGDMGIGVYVDGQSNLITRNHVHDLTMIVNTPAAGDDYGAVAFWIENHNNEVSYNTAENCKASSMDWGFDGGFVEIFNFGDDTHIHHNLATNTWGFVEMGGSGVEGTGATGVRVHHNILVNTVNCFCLHNTGTFAIPITDLQFDNNTVYKTDAVSGFDQFACTTNYAGLTSRNNIFNVNRQVASNGTFTHQGNLYFMTGGAGIGFTLHASEITGNPLFVAPGTDFHLQAGSPAANSGQSLGYAADFEGASVPQGAGPDMGAYEGTGVPLLWSATPAAGDVGGNWDAYMASAFVSVDTIIPGSIVSFPDGAALQANFQVGGLHGSSDVCEQLVGFTGAQRTSVMLQYEVYLDPAVDYLAVGNLGGSQTIAYLTFPGLVGGSLWPGPNGLAYPVGGEAVDEGWSARIRVVGSGAIAPYLYVQNKPGAFGWSRVSAHPLRINDLRGAWSLWEETCVMNTPGVANGRCILRINADTIVDVSDIEYRPASAGWVNNGVRIELSLTDSVPALQAFNIWFRKFKLFQVVS